MEKPHWGRGQKQGKDGDTGDVKDRRTTDLIISGGEEVWRTVQKAQRSTQAVNLIDDEGRCIAGWFCIRGIQ